MEFYSDLDEKPFSDYMLTVPQKVAEAFRAVFKPKTKTGYSLLHLQNMKKRTEFRTKTELLGDAGKASGLMLLSVIDKL